MDCKRTFPAYVMDLDHVRGEKRFHLADVWRTRRAKSTVLAEIAKCDAVCSNCHRVRTHNRKTKSKG